MRLEPLEAAVLHKLLDGDHPALVALRRQLPALSVTSRELTGSGFFTTFAVSDIEHPSPTVSLPSPLGDVTAEISGLRHGAGFLLYIEEGRLHMLEGYSHDEPWPERIESFALVYASADRSSELAKLG